ncbi:unnamed protein product, partial [Ectocarpus fasciculatus]
MDAETAHEWAVWLAQSPLLHPRCAVTPPRLYPSQDSDLEDPVLGQTVWGMRFSSPLGLAAGFDKDGRAVGGMLDLGFSFVEVGSVTPLPQPGNPRPRLFRLEADDAVINRYGFNSSGADAVRCHLSHFRAKARLHRYGLVGVNAGKNESTEGEDVKEDYSTVISKLGPEADYVVINVSSPNTPGLRGLQQKDSLRALVRHSPEDHSRSSGKFPAEATDTKRIPLFVKIAPDLTIDERRDIAAVCVELGVDGVVACNSTVSRPAALTSTERGESGGLSGAPVRSLSTQLTFLIGNMPVYSQVPIIGVGGVGSGQDAFEKVAAGASLVQIYTMMAVKGPGTVKRIKTELADVLHERGFRNISEAVGSENAR